MSDADSKFQFDQTKRPGLFVILAGLATTFLTMLGIYFVNKLGFQPMGFYVWGIAPVGALLVGLIAGSGYGAGSYFTGAKIGRGLLLLVLALQFVAYSAAQYVEYLDSTERRKRRPDFKQVSFLKYFDMATRSFAFRGQNGRAGNPLGGWGYGLRALEIIGFLGGGLIAPAILFTVPYCDRCQVYRKTRELGVLPAGVKPRKIKKKDVLAQQAYDAQIQEALEAGLGALDRMEDCVEGADPRGFLAILGEQPQRKEIEKLTGRLLVAGQQCPKCRRGRVVVSMVVGTGDTVEKKEVIHWEVEEPFLEAVTTGAQGLAKKKRPKKEKPEGDDA